VHPCLRPALPAFSFKPLAYKQRGRKCLRIQCLALALPFSTAHPLRTLNLALICRRPVKRMAAAVAAVRRKTFSTTTRPPQGDEMNYFACFTLDLTGVLIFLGIVILIEMAVTGVIAALISFLFKARIRLVFGMEMIALLVCAGVAGSLGNQWEGTAILTLLGAGACLVMLMVSWLWAFIRGGWKAEESEALYGLNLTDHPTAETAK
jgi:hypothetical protein